MRRLLHHFRLVVVVVFVCIFANGCTRAARRARLTHLADADFAAERYAEAELEYRGILQKGMDPHAMAQLGILYFREGRFAAAFAALRKAEQLDPKNAAVKAALGSIYFSSHDAAEALREARESLALQPTNGEAMLLLGDASLSNGETRSSEAFLRALPARSTLTADWHDALATLRLKQGDAAGAEGELRRALACDSKSAIAHCLLGQIYLSQTNFIAATNELTLGVSLSPWRSAIRLHAAEDKARSESPAAARRSLEEITSHAPDFLPAWTALMRLDFSLKQFDDCRKIIETISSLDPGNLDAGIETGLINLDAQNYQGATRAFQQLEERYPRVAEVKYYLGLTSLAQGDQIKAQLYFGRAADLNTNFVQAILRLAELDARSGNSTAAVRRLQRLIRQDPALPEPRLLLAEILVGRHDTTSALAAYNDVIKMRPRDAKVPYLMGLALLQSGDLTEAHRSFERAVELAPNSLAPLDRLIRVEILQKQYVQALQTVQKRLDAEPNQGRLWFLKSEVDSAQKRLSQVEADLNQAVKAEPSFVPAYVALADLYVATHQDQQAVDKLNAVVTKTNDVTALMTLGLLQERLRHPEAARDAYEKALAVHPDSAAVLNNLACLCSEDLGQADKAYVYAQKARELRPKDPYIADTLGWILFQRGDYERALSLLREAADGEPGAPEVQFHLGMAYYMSGNEQQAASALQASVSSAAGFPGDGVARAHLAILSEKISDTNGAAIERLEQAVRADPKDPVAQSRLGQVEEMRKAYDKAAQHYREALRVTPLNVAVLVRLATLDADHLKNEDEALDLAKRAHTIDADDLEACALLGRLTYEHGDYPDALVLLRKAASSDHASPRLSYDLGRALYVAGYLKESEDSLRRALAGAPAADWSDEGRQFLELAQAPQSPETSRAALPQAESILQKRPTFEPALMVCAAAAEADGDFKKAAAIYEKAATIIPDFPLADRQLALLYSQHLSDDAKALVCGEKARRANLRDFDLDRAMGVSACRAGQFTRSVELLQETRRAADDPLVEFYLGLDYLQLKRANDGKAALKRALAMHLPSNLASEAQQALASSTK